MWRNEEKSRDVRESIKTGNADIKITWITHQIALSRSWETKNWAVVNKQETIIK